MIRDRRLGALLGFGAAFIVAGLGLLTWPHGKPFVLLPAENEIPVVTLAAIGIYGLPVGAVLGWLFGPGIARSRTTADWLVRAFGAAVLAVPAGVFVVFLTTEPLDLFLPVAWIAGIGLAGLPGLPVTIVCALAASRILRSFSPLVAQGPPWGVALGDPGLAGWHDPNAPTRTPTAAVAWPGQAAAPGSAPALTYTGPTSATPAEPIVLSATASTAAGVGSSGRTMTFTLDGSTDSSTTDPDGRGAIARAAPTTIGSYTIIVKLAGKTLYDAASGVATLEVSPLGSAGKSAALRILQDLHAAGVLTDAEFEERKARSGT